MTNGEIRIRLRTQKVERSNRAPRLFDFRCPEFPSLFLCSLMLLRARQFEFSFPRPTLVMGIVNVTPDSFSDGGQFLQPDAAVAHGLQLIAEGAEIIDIGGESSRPQAVPVAEAEELRRVIPVIEQLAGCV